MDLKPAPAGRLRIVVAGWEGGGNVPPLMAAVRALGTRGHDVTVVGDDAMASDAKAAGARFAGWRRAPNRPDRSAASSLVRDAELPDAFAAIAAWCDRLFIGPAEAHARDLLEVIAAQRAHLLIASDLLFGSVLAGEAVGIPTAVLAANVSLWPLPGHPPFGPGFHPAASDADRERDLAVTEGAEMFWNRFLPGLNAARQTFGCGPLARVFDQPRMADLHLLATSPAFDYPVTTLPDDVRYIGPLLDEPGWAGAAGAATDASALPLVLVSFSTTDQGQDHLVARLIGVLGRLPVRAIVTLGNMLEGVELPAPSNVRIVAAGSHERILPHAAAVITHGGHGTTLRALSHGVPLLVLPMGRDQNENAARVEYHGAGLRLDPASTDGAIADALSRLITDPAFAAGARGIAAALRAEPPARERLVAEIERLAAGCRKLPTHAA